MANNNYTEEFRRNAVDLCESSPDQTMQMIAKDLGVSRSALHTWVAKYGTGARVSSARAETVAPGDESAAIRISQLEAQLAKAEAEMRELILERDLHRQVAKYFAREAN